MKVTPEFYFSWLICQMPFWHNSLGKIKKMLIFTTQRLAYSDLVSFGLIKITRTWLCCMKSQRCLVTTFWNLLMLQLFLRNGIYNNKPIATTLLHQKLALISSIFKAGWSDVSKMVRQEFPALVTSQTLDGTNKKRCTEEGRKDSFTFHPSPYPNPGSMAESSSDGGRTAKWTLWQIPVPALGNQQFGTFKRLILTLMTHEAWKWRDGKRYSR